MVNRYEPLLNVVDENKPKVLTIPGRANRLGPKGKGSGMGACNSPIADGEPPAERRNLSHAVGTCAERGKPVGLPLGKRAARDADGPAGKRGRRKRRSPCNGEDRG